MVNASPNGLGFPSWITETGLKKKKRDRDQFKTSSWVKLGGSGEEKLWQCLVRWRHDSRGNACSWRRHTASKNAAPWDAKKKNKGWILRRGADIKKVFYKKGRVKHLKGKKEPRPGLSGPSWGGEAWIDGKRTRRWNVLYFSSLNFFCNMLA